MGRTEITRLTDREFFLTCVDTTHEGLSELSSLAESGDFDAARRIFAEYVRANLECRADLTSRRKALEPSAEAIKREGERVMGHTLISCRTPYTFGKVIDWTINPTYNNYREWPWQLNRHHEWAHLANYYALTWDERIAVEWAEQFMGWAEQAQVPDRDDWADCPCWRTIEAAIRMMDWHRYLGVFINSPAADDDLITVFFKSVCEHADRLCRAKAERNFLIMAMHGLAEIGFNYPFLKNSAMWLDHANRRLEEQIDVQFYPDGMHYEMTIHYHKVCLGNYLDVLNMYRNAGKEPPEYLKKGLLRMYGTFTKMARPDLVCPTMNDGEALDASRALVPALQLYPERDDFRYFVTRRAEGKAPDVGSAFYEYSGIVIMRSGWDEDAYWAYMDGSPLGRGHHHDDTLNIQLYALGHELIPEAGQFDYDTSEMRAYTTSSRGHNTSCMDGLGMNRRKFYKWNPEDIAKKSDTRWYPSDTRDTAECDYSSGYGEEPLLYVNHTRRLIFVKIEQDLPPFFAVIDRFTSPDEDKHDYELIWHMHDNPTLLSGNTVMNTYPDGVGITIASSDGTISVVRGQKSPVFQGWLPNYGVGDVEHHPIPTALNKGRFTGTRRVVTILAPFDGGEPFVKSVEASNDADAKEFTIVLADGRRVNLAE